MAYCWQRRLFVQVGALGTGSLLSLGRVARTKDQTSVRVSLELRADLCTITKRVGKGCTELSSGPELARYKSKGMGRPGGSNDDGEEEHLIEDLVDHRFIDLDAIYEVPAGGATKLAGCSATGVRLRRLAANQRMN
jgi:hypothetical protein